LIGEYFLRLASNSPMIFTTGSATQELQSPTSRSSFRSVSKLMIFGNGEFLRWRVHEMRFPVTPFDGRQPVGDVGREALAMGMQAACRRASHQHPRGPITGCNRRD
jgi:hypothetical protein